MEENNSQQNNKGDLKNIRTYMSDMADTVRQNEISVIKVALAEQNKHEREDLYRKVEGTPVKKIFWFIGGLILIAGAIYGSYFLLKQKQIKNIPQQIVKEEAIISYDEISPINITNSDTLLDKINSVKNESNTSGKNNSIKFISLTEDVNGLKENIPVKELFAKLEWNASSSLPIALSDTYMVGTYTKDTNSKPSLFIIFQPKDYEYAYAGMLNWEKTMAGDLLSLFNLDTQENTLQLNERQFKDIILNNKDARVLFNENTKTILYYLFADKNNIIITDMEDTIKEINSRLIIKNLKPL